MGEEQFKFALEHCPSAAMSEIRQYFRIYPFEEAAELTAEMVAAYCRATGKTRGRVNYALRQVAKFAGKL